VLNLEIVTSSLYIAVYAIALPTVFARILQILLRVFFITYNWLVFNIKFIVLYVVSYIITLHTSHCTVLCFYELLIFIPHVFSVVRINFCNITSSRVMKVIYSRR
jgi:hypothetical protein